MSWYGKYEEPESSEEKLLRKVREQIRKENTPSEDRSMMQLKGDKYNREEEES